MTAILFSLILLFPSIGFSMVIDACCVTDYEVCCSQDFNPTSCHSTMDQDNCDDVTLIILPPNQIDFTLQKSIELPTSFLTKLPKYLPPLFHLPNGYNLNPSTYLNNHRHPSIFQVFLC